MVGGNTQGVWLESTSGLPFKNVTPVGAPLLQGVSAGDKGSLWTVGERGQTYSQAVPGASIVGSLSVPDGAPGQSLHATSIDSDGGAWAVGGNVLTPALDAGLVVYNGPKRVHIAPMEISQLSPPVPDGGAPAATCPAEVILAGKTKSIARRWNEQLLASIERRARRFPEGRRRR